MNSHILIIQIQQLKFYQVASLNNFSFSSLPFSFFSFFSYSFAFRLKYWNQILDLNSLPLYTPMWGSKTNQAIFKQNHTLIITLYKINSNFLLSSNTQYIFSFPCLENAILQLVCKIGNQIKSLCEIWFLFCLSLFNLKQPLLSHYFLLKPLACWRNLVSCL